MLCLEVEETGPWQERSSSSAHQAAQAEVPMLLCARACVHTHVCVRLSACVTMNVCNVVGVDVGIHPGLPSSVLCFGKLLVWAHSQTERMRDTERGRESHSPALITLLKTTSRHRVYLSRLCKPQPALCSKSHFRGAADSVCSIRVSCISLRSSLSR